MEFDTRKLSKKRTLFKFSDGSRSVSIGNIMIAPGKGELLELVDLTGLNEIEFEKIKAKPNDDKFIKNTINRIDKVKKDRLK